jgi:hypothetical protein
MVSIVTNPGARELIKPPVVEILRNLITTDKNTQNTTFNSCYRVIALSRSAFLHRLRRHCQDLAFSPLLPVMRNPEFEVRVSDASQTASCKFFRNRLGRETGPGLSSKRVTPPKRDCRVSPTQLEGPGLIHGFPSGIIR